MFRSGGDAANLGKFLFVQQQLGGAGQGGIAYDMDFGGQFLRDQTDPGGAGNIQVAAEAACDIKDFDLVAVG